MEVENIEMNIPEIERGVITSRSVENHYLNIVLSKTLKPFDNPK